MPNSFGSANPNVLLGNSSLSSPAAGDTEQKAGVRARVAVNIALGHTKSRAELRQRRHAAGVDMYYTHIVAR